MLNSLVWASLFMVVSTAPDSAQTTFATDIRALATGVDAVSFDPAAAGAVEGLELHSRYGALEGEHSPGAAGLYGVLPLGDLQLSAGYDWLAHQGERFERSTVGGSLRLGETTWVGLARRSFRERQGAEPFGASWDAGIYAQPSSWLAWSAGVEALNAPMDGGKTRTPTWNLGLGVQPLRGTPWLRLGADLRWGRRNTEAYWGELEQARGLLEVEPVEGVRLQGAWVSRPEGDQLWLGLALESGGVEVRGAQGAGGRVGESFRKAPRRSLLRSGKRTVHLELSGDLLPEPTSLFHPGVPISVVTLQMNELAGDDSVEHVVLTVGRLRTGLAQVDELRRGIARLREAGKTVHAYITQVEDKGYLVAAAANKLFLDPMGQITLDGFAITRRYYADSLEKLGVRFEAVALESYKTGADSLTRNASRATERETLGHLLDQAFGSLRRGLQQDRGLSEAQVDALLKEGQFGAARAMELGLVDELTGKLEPNALPRELPRALAFGDTRRATRRWGPARKILVVPVVGALVGEGGGSPLLGESVSVEEVFALLQRAEEDREVAAVVLRINSPGGELMAAERLWRKIRALCKEKPVVVSMGNVAASGGYYIAAPAHAIFAEENTVTGSIGIFSLRPNLAGFYRWLGVNNETTIRGEQADWAGDTHALTPAGKARLEKSLRRYYDTFVGKVAAGRRMDLKAAYEVAQGKVFSGLQAKENGLVDEVGGLVDAIKKAMSLSGLSDDGEAVIYVAQRSFDFSAVLSKAVQGPSTVQEGVQTWLKAMKEWEDNVLALMPMGYEVGP